MVHPGSAGEPGVDFLLVTAYVRVDPCRRTGMKLHYYRPPGGGTNFGDALNLWLWPKLLPLDDDPGVRLLAIGSQLNRRVASRFADARRIHVLGTGVGYGFPPRLDPRWRVHCVRGPWTAWMLGLPQRAAVADGALLVRRYVRARRDGSVAYMPHFSEGHPDVWARVAPAAGIECIDPRLPVPQVLEALCHARLVLSESLHGAIVADALRVPWIAVRTSERIPPLKWRDWCASLGLVYRPHELRLPSWLWSSRLVEPALACWLRRVARHGRPCLSSDERLERRCAELSACVARLAEAAG